MRAFESRIGRVPEVCVVALTTPLMLPVADSATAVYAQTITMRSAATQHPTAMARLVISLDTNLIPSQRRTLLCACSSGAIEIKGDARPQQDCMVVVVAHAEGEKQLLTYTITKTEHSNRLSRRYFRRYDRTGNGAGCAQVVKGVTAKSSDPKSTTNRLEATMYTSFSLISRTPVREFSS